MNIALLAHNLRQGGGLSIGRTITSRLPSHCPQHRFLVTAPAGDQYREAERLENVTVVRPPSSNPLQRLLWERTTLKRAVDAFEPEWIWALGNYGLKRPGARQSILFHDPHLVYPAETFGEVGRLYKFKKRLLKRCLASSLRHTSTVYCQTQTVSRRFSETFSFPLEKIRLCPPAYSLLEEKLDQKPIDLPIKKDADTFQLLYVSSCSGHKNHRQLVRTFAKHANELKNVVCYLTIDEQENGLAASVLREARELGVSQSIIPLGHLEHAAVKACYRNTDALIFPSLLETAGLPLIEAMHHKMPIIVSDRDFAHELCGDAACYVEPTDTTSIRDAIIKLRDDKEYRAQLAVDAASRSAEHVKGWDEILTQVLCREGILK